MSNKPARQIPAEPQAERSPRATLTRQETQILAEALEQCREAAEEVQDRVVGLGVKLLRTVFKGSVEAALEGNDRVWHELQDRAGGSTLRLSRKTLSVALRLAAWDKKIQDDRWRLLDIGRKELLLPLADPTLLRDGAKHVTAMRMTQRATTRYVREKLRELNDPPSTRFTPARMAGDLRRLRERYTDQGARERLRGIADDPNGRAKVVTEIDATIALLKDLKRILRP